MPWQPDLPRGEEPSLKEAVKSWNTTPMWVKVLLGAMLIAAVLGLIF